MPVREINPAFSMRSIRRVYGIPFSEGNKVMLLWKNSESFRVIFDAVREAKRIICLEFYIFRNDETGIELAEILRQKALEGVRVYVLIDHFGSIEIPWKFWRSLGKSGITVRTARPFIWRNPRNYIHRDHRKLIVIDGEKAFTGGLNIANEYRGYHRLKKKAAGWRDTGILLEGPVAGTLLQTFRESWLLWKGGPIRFRTDVRPFASGLSVLPIFASSAKGRRRMRKLLYYSITRAKKSIFLTTAYFTPSRRMMQVLAEAVMRGVDVKLLLPGISDITAAHYAGRAFFRRLLRSGVEIYTYKGVILHAKTSVFDGIWSVIGSANLDFQSLRRNDEGNVGIVDEDFGKQMTSIFLADLENSEKITLEKWSKRPFFEKLMEHFFALFRRRL